MLEAMQEQINTVSEKVDRLEVLFGHFMIQTTSSLHRIDRSIERMEETVERMGQTVERIEMQQDRDRREWERRWAETKRENAEEREKDRREWNERWENLTLEREQEKREWNERWENLALEREQEKREWEERWEKLAREREEEQRKWDERWAELQRERKKEKREWNKRWGDLANRLGTIVEDIVAPNMPRIAKTHFGIKTINDFMVRRHIRSPIDRSKRREFDVIVVGDDRVVINETKAHIRIEYIDSFIAALAEIDLYFPEYRGKTIIPVFASLYLSQDVVNYLTKNNLYAMGMGEETMQLLNLDKLRARGAIK